MTDPMKNSKIPKKKYSLNHRNLLSIILLRFYGEEDGLALIMGFFAMLSFILLIINLMALISLAPVAFLISLVLLLASAVPTLYLTQPLFLTRFDDSKANGKITRLQKWIARKEMKIFDKTGLVDTVSDFYTKDYVLLLAPEIDLINDEPDYSSDIRLKKEQEKNYPDAHIVLTGKMERIRNDDDDSIMGNTIFGRVRTMLLWTGKGPLPYDSTSIEAMNALMQAANPLSSSITNSYSNSIDGHDDTTIGAYLEVYGDIQDIITKWRQLQGSLKVSSTASGVLDWVSEWTDSANTLMDAVSQSADELRNSMKVSEFDSRTARLAELAAKAQSVYQQGLKLDDALTTLKASNPNIGSILDSSERLDTKLGQLSKMVSEQYPDA